MLQSNGSLHLRLLAPTHHAYLIHMKRQPPTRLMLTHANFRMLNPLFAKVQVLLLELTIPQMMMASLDALLNLNPNYTRLHSLLQHMSSFRIGGLTSHF